MNVSYLKRISFSIIITSCLFLTSCQQLIGNKTAELLKYDRQAKELVAQMTLDEKIGQMIQAENTGLKDLSDIENYHLGSILSGGSSDPKAGNSPTNWTELYESLQSRTKKTRLQIPLLYGIDAVHGHSNIVGATIFPHNVGLGCTRNAKLVEEAAQITAKEMRGTGIQWTFAPCITVPQDERWGRTYEGFSEDPILVSKLGAAAVKGFQGDSLDNPYSVLACSKHYVADGGTSPNTSKAGWDQGDTRVDEATLRRIHLYPYPASVKNGVGSIMPSYSSWNGLKSSANKYLLTDVLKKEIGFEGFLISDYNAIGQIDPDFKKAIGISVNAGMDMAMEPTNYRQFFKYLKELVQEGTVPMSRIDDAVTRILRVKFAMGMMDSYYNYKADLKLQKEIGSDAHRKVARQAVRESLVLLKNDNDTLPLSKSLKRIHIGGKAANDIGIQCGGWTIEWQGKAGPITKGTTFLQAVKNAVSSDTKVTYQENGTGAEGADVAIVVIGEKPYAEGNGDSKTLTLDKEDIQTVANMKKAGIPVVVILYSGRPMIVESTINDADAFVAAWLPGTEGDGIADVLFGDCKPKGKLSFTWPKSTSQLPINIGDKDYDPLFPYGYGLSY